MKNDFKMNYSEEDFVKLSKSFFSSGIIMRLLAYIAIYSISTVVFIILLTFFHSPSDNMTTTIFMLAIVFLPMMILLFLFEKYNIQKTREKLKLSLYKNVQKELLDIATEVRVAREKKAFEVNGINQGIDKSDLGYWHGLLKSGAITQEEYEAKKKELM